jgi:hypothetical protein
MALFRQIQRFVYWVPAFAGTTAFQPTPPPLAAPAFSTLAAQNLNSGIFLNGWSSGLVKILAAASTKATVLLSIMSRGRFQRTGRSPADQLIVL